MTRTCVICGACIDHRDPQCTTCSFSCRCKARYARRSAARASDKAPRLCLHCNRQIFNRGARAVFCSHLCLIESTRARAKAARVKAKCIRSCGWCNNSIPPELHRTAVYCCVDCRYMAGKKREREKIAHYRVCDPVRYRGHRQQENEKRAQARAALTLFRQIESKGLEALL